ncbi:hypothetical protein BS47DRAFT_755917 [Hydnum rufescens UP504]|uniref:Uncharacterized protein n=1 Tax=Hydnum rufescens UP504 TaxID=1448309 RepID=A0A9P6BAN3_9AGAM|nr:hypothetical protein BS47DRAFT_755917 [Hydnum rufescens UP504]
MNLVQGISWKECTNGRRSLGFAFRLNPRSRASSSSSSLVSTTGTVESDISSISSSDCTRALASALILAIIRAVESWIVLSGKVPRPVAAWGGDTEEDGGVRGNRDDWEATMGSSLISAAEVSGLVFSGVGKNEWFLTGDRCDVEGGGEGVGSQSMVSCFTVGCIAGKSVEESSPQKGDNDICTLLSSPLDMLSASSPSIPGLVRTLPGSECVKVKPGSESEEIIMGVFFKVGPGMGDADSEEVSASSTGRDLEPMSPAASILFRRVVASLEGGGNKSSILVSPSVEDISMGILDVPGRVRGRGPCGLNWLF